ncbi:ClpP/crotonase [Violaceomyces palustris]|uniref:ClpP/crotonase n=1 Tax=Violaceomyces palustris TaxID=1673888 RepID=A0ACD0P381_9BASI|nr:ClpP/crotonase [Violaceomyces palustris]
MRHNLFRSTSKSCSLIASHSPVASQPLTAVRSTAALKSIRLSFPSQPSQPSRHLSLMSKPDRRLSQISRHMSSSATSAAASSSPRNAVGGDDKLVLTSSEGSLRTITLNRPSALNALNQEMVDLLDQAITSFTRSSSCQVILLRGNGRALCSGGDVLAVVKAADSPDPKVREKALTFFQKEFQLDYKIARLGESAYARGVKQGGEDARMLVRSKEGGGEAVAPKVFVSIMDGITMGGGVGLSVHAPFRVATERTLFAMPETGIGYFPDVGVTRVLARLDGKVGQYLGLTGARISGEEAYLVGLATHYIASSNIDSLAFRLSTLPVETGSNPCHVSDAICEYSAEPFAEGSEVLSKTPFLGDRRIALDYAFGQPSTEALLGCLEEIASEGAESTQAASELKQLGLEQITPEVRTWAAETLETLKTKSPRSLKVSHQAILEARRLDVEEAFRFDMRLATTFCDLSIGRDFYEGVTHVLEKDPATGKRRSGIANWNPKRLEEVADSKVRSLFFADVETAKEAGLNLEVPKLESIPEPSTSTAVRQARDSALRGKGPLRWEPAHNVFALPSEAELEALREGSHPASGAVRLEDDELLDCIRRWKGDLVGLEVKVGDWLDRSSRRK